MRTILIGLVVLALLGLGAVYLGTQNEVLGPTTNPPTTPTTTESTPTPTSVTIPDDFRLYAATEHQYTIGLPNGVDVSKPQAQVTRYRFVGPGSEPATEITDGYTITIEAEPTTADSLEELVATRIDQGDITVTSDQVTSVTLADEPGRQYVTTSELGDTPLTYYLLLPGNKYAYTISTNIRPTDSSAYQTEVAQILNSLEFVTQSVAADLASRTISIAMLDYDAVSGQYVRQSNGPERGCDRVVMIEHVLNDPTQTPLTAALKQLFAYDNSTVGGWQNFIASRTDTLQFERVDLVDGVAQVYLSGTLGPLGGVCDNPRTAIQIEETALAVSGVTEVELYLNGEQTELMPSGRRE